MRTFLFLFLFACSMRSQAQFAAYLPFHPAARIVADNEVPAQVRVNFYSVVKGVIPSWTIDSTLYMAAYNDSLKLGHIHTYDTDGTLLSIQVEQDDTGFPAPIEKFHDTYYPKEKYTVWQITDASGNKMYYFTRQKKTLWFNPQGDLIELSKNQQVKQPAR